jgi:hypothetical protein
MSKIKGKVANHKRELGRAIVEEWVYAAQNNVPVSRERLLGRLAGILEKTSGGGNDPASDFDVIVDEQVKTGGPTPTQFVWIVIPVPDPPNKADWQQWILANHYDQNTRLEALGDAVIFGCGR